MAAGGANRTGWGPRLGTAKDGRRMIPMEDLQ
jgi:hypothetical protein